MVVTVSTATPIVLPLGLALVVAPVVFTPLDDTVTVVLEFALVLVVVEEVIEPLPSLPLLDELLLANAHIVGCTARAAANTKAAHFFSYPSPLLSFLLKFYIQ